MQKMSLLLLLVGGAITANAQKDPILLSVAGNNVTKSEFEKIYKKNNSKDNNIDKKSVQNYVEIYVNYKLKVKEAEDEKLDTSSAFTEELNGYRKQLSQPYLTDKVVTESLLKEAFERYKNDIRASHILIKVASDALPKDTLDAYKKAMAIRERILKGADFASVAKAESQDPSAKENGGDLGYFTALQMVYQFESAAYKAKLNEISMPVRTRFGYHIIKVTETRPAQGDLHVAHIMVKAGATATPEEVEKAKTKINEIAAKIKAGEKFDDLAKQFSDDIGSGRNGGVLPWFGTGRMVPEFEKAAFALKNDNDVSEPIRSAYGFHIIKRLEKKGLPSYETMQADLKTKIAKDTRSEMSKLSMINKIKKQYNFKEFPKAKEEILGLADTTLIEGMWHLNKPDYTKPLFVLNNKNYTQEDFAKYVTDHQSKSLKKNASFIMDGLYKQYLDESCIAYEESRLDTKYPDFKALMQEYKDGILLFELTDRKVWTKAVKDTSGLKEFYNKNKNNYMWSNRLQAIIYTTANADIAKKVRSLLSAPKPISNDSLLALINKESQLNLSIKEGKFSQGDNDVIDGITWEPGMTKDIEKNKSVIFVNVKAKIAPEPKTLEEAKGAVTADCQAFLEKQWITQLRAKYPVVINKDVLATVAQ
jgi:peptidyl-prolyl cis-trans isomerase SurA